MPSPARPPVWISHRGLRESHPENTLGAFRAAVRAGFSALETDLRVSRDGGLVLSHDPTLGRICGDPRRIRDLTCDELLRIPLPGGNRLLLFDEFMHAFPDCRWTFDVKPEHGAETVRALASWAAARGMVSRLRAQATFLVWRPAHERLVEAHFPGAVLYAGKRECIRAGLAALLGLPAGSGIRPGTTYGLPPRLGRLPLYRAPMVRYYRRRGARLLAFLPERSSRTSASARPS